MDIIESPYYNWNRIAMLSKAGVKADKYSTEPNELTTRIGLQNMYSCAGDKEIMHILCTIHSTITPEIEKAVDKFMEGPKTNKHNTQR